MLLNIGSVNGQFRMETATHSCSTHIEIQKVGTNEEHYISSDSVW